MSNEAAEARRRRDGRGAAAPHRRGHTGAREAANGDPEERLERRPRAGGDGERARRRQEERRRADEADVADDVAQDAREPPPRRRRAGRGEARLGRDAQPPLVGRGRRRGVEVRRRGAQVAEGEVERGALVVAAALRAREVVARAREPRVRVRSRRRRGGLRAAQVALEGRRAVRAGQARRRRRGRGFGPELADREARDGADGRDDREHGEAPEPELRVPPGVLLRRRAARVRGPAALRGLLRELREARRRFRQRLRPEMRADGRPDVGVPRHAQGPRHLARALVAELHGQELAAVVLEARGDRPRADRGRRARGDDGVGVGRGRAHAAERRLVARVVGAGEVLVAEVPAAHGVRLHGHGPREVPARPVGRRRLGRRAARRGRPAPLELRLDGRALLLPGVQGGLGRHRRVGRRFN